MDILKHFVELLNKHFNINAERYVSFSKDYGDIEIKLAFPLSKIKGISLEEAASSIAGIVKQSEYVKDVSVVKGYVNVTLSDKCLKDFLLADLSSVKTIKEKYIVEYPSVNPNKPWHAGHLRNALIGHFIANLLSFLGADVIRMNYVDDLGLQIAQSFWYYKKYGLKCNKKFDHCVGEAYVKAAKLAEEHDKEIREIMKNAEKGALKKELRQFAEKVLLAQYETAFKFNIFNDIAVFESDVINIEEKGLELLKRKGLLRYVNEGEKKGCYVLGDKVIIRSDGTLTYTGKDILFHMWKIGIIDNIYFKPFIKQPNGKVLLSSASKGELLTLKDYKAINIIGIEQTLPQKIVANAISALGFKDYIKHLAYAPVKLKNMHFSGRKGTWIGYSADDIINEGINRVIKKMINKDYKRALKIAKAALIFSFLKVNLKKEVIFDWDNALALEGDTGVYVLYGYVRSLSVLKHTNKEAIPPQTIDEIEKPLIVEMLKYKTIINEAFNNLDPSVITNYLLKLAKAFHKFYARAKIIGSKREAQRLYILKRFNKLLELLLNILNIEVVEEM